MATRKTTTTTTTTTTPTKNSNNIGKRYDINHGNINGSIVISQRKPVTNLNSSVTVDGLYENFCVCQTFVFDNTGKPLGSAIVTALGYFGDEVLKLHGIEYYENPLVIKMSKSLLNNKVTLSNFEYSLNLFSLFTQIWKCKINCKRKDIALVLDGLPEGMGMKGLNVCAKGGGIPLNHFLAPN